MKLKKFGANLMRKRQKLYADYSDDDHKRINYALMMCSEMDDSNQDHIGGVFKFAIIQGFIRSEDANALAKSDPYLVNIMVGGCNTSLKEWLAAQATDTPYTLRECFDGVLKYYPLIVSDYLKFRDSMKDLHTKKLLSYSISKHESDEPFAYPYIFGEQK